MNATTATGPVVLGGGRVVSPALDEDRDRAVAVAKDDRRWKAHMLALMDDPAAAARSGLPTYDAVLSNSYKGYATTVPMIVAWRVAEYRGLISPDMLRDLCAQQVALIRSEIARFDATNDLRALLPLYEAGATGRGRLGEEMGKPASDLPQPPGSTLPS